LAKDERCLGLIEHVFDGIDWCEPTVVLFGDSVVTISNVESVFSNFSADAGHRLLL